MRARTGEPARGEAGEAPVLRRLGDRSVVLVGMPGAGKSSIGRRLAARLGVPFVDADTEIERAAGMTISEIFARHGEPSFRDGERRVIGRLLEGGPQVLATGGGAFMDEATRAAVRANGVSVWLKADLETLHARVRRRTHRPLLAGSDARERLAALLEARAPVFATADITVTSADGPHDAVVERILADLDGLLSGTADPRGSS